MTTAALIISVLGSYLVYILYQGVTINSLPHEMHTQLRTAASAWHLLAENVAVADAARNKLPKWTSSSTVPDDAAAIVPSPADFYARCRANASLLRHCASDFAIDVVDVPFCVLFVPLNKATISAALATIGVAAISAIISVVQSKIRL